MTRDRYILYIRNSFIKYAVCDTSYSCMYYKLGNNSTKGAVNNTAHVYKYYVSYKLQRYDLSVLIKSTNDT